MVYPARSMRKPLHATKRVAVLGVGKLGAAMARRLSALGRDVDVAVWSRSATARGRARPDALRQLERAGARIAETPAECVQDANFVLAVLADGAATRAVLRGKDGALAGMISSSARRRPLFVDASTSGRRAALELAEALAAHEIAYVDAAMSGTVGPAERGELVTMVGASKRDLARAKPLLDLLCKRIIHAGGVGQGQALKVVLNGVGAHHFVAFASMLALGERAGLSRAVLLDAFTTGAFASPSYVGKKDKALARAYGDPDFTLRLARKDAALNLELQREVGLSLPVVKALARAMDAAVAEGLGEGDLFGIEEHFRRR